MSDEDLTSESQNEQMQPDHGGASHFGLPHISDYEDLVDKSRTLEASAKESDALSKVFEIAFGYTNDPEFKKSPNPTFKQDLADSIDRAFNEELAQLSSSNRRDVNVTQTLKSRVTKQVTESKEAEAKKAIIDFIEEGFGAKLTDIWFSRVISKGQDVETSTLRSKIRDAARSLQDVRYYGHDLIDAVVKEQIDHMQVRLSEQIQKTKPLGIPHLADLRHLLKGRNFRLNLGDQNVLSRDEIKFGSLAETIDNRKDLILKKIAQLKGDIEKKSLEITDIADRIASSLKALQEAEIRLDNLGQVIVLPGANNKDSKDSINSEINDINVRLTKLKARQGTAEEEIKQLNKDLSAQRNTLSIAPYARDLITYEFYSSVNKGLERFDHNMDSRRRRASNEFDPGALPKYPFGLRLNGKNNNPDAKEPAKGDSKTQQHLKQISKSLKSLPVSSPHLRDINNETLDAQIAMDAAMSVGYVIRNNIRARLFGDNFEKIGLQAKQAGIYLAEREMVRNSINAREGVGTFCRLNESKTAYDIVYSDLSVIAQGENIAALSRDIDKRAGELEQALKDGAHLILANKVKLTGTNGSIETYPLGTDNFFSQRSMGTIISRIIPPIPFLPGVKRHGWVSGMRAFERAENSENQKTASKSILKGTTLALGAVALTVGTAIVMPLIGASAVATLGAVVTATVTCMSVNNIIKKEYVTAGLTIGGGILGALTPAGWLGAAAGMLTGQGIGKHKVVTALAWGVAYVGLFAVAKVKEVARDPLGLDKRPLSGEIVKTINDGKQWAESKLDGIINQTQYSTDRPSQPTIDEMLRSGNEPSSSDQSTGKKVTIEEMMRSGNKADPSIKTTPPKKMSDEELINKLRENSSNEQKPSFKDRFGKQKDNLFFALEKKPQESFVASVQEIRSANTSPKQLG